MAVSGRKTPGFKDSLSIGSAEDFDVCCDPCKFLDKAVEAKEFCVDCQENLCKRCVDAHKSTKTSRHHQLLDQPQTVTGGTSPALEDSKICTEYCNIHKEEPTVFFCSKHDRVGCGDCMTSDHRTSKVDYIPDVCSGVLKSTEFSGTLQNVSNTLKKVKVIEEKAQLKKTENKTSVREVVKEIETFQKEINDRIEQLKQQLVTEANSYMTNRDQEIDKISDSCARVHSELKQVLTALKDCQSKQLDLQAFVTMKQAQWVINFTNIHCYEEDITNSSTTILFQPNNELATVLFQQCGLGKYVLPLSNVVKKEQPKVGIGQYTEAILTITQESATVLNCIKQTKTINVRTESDKYDCGISGCAVISADRLVLADCENNKLKIVNTDTLAVVKEFIVDPSPYDVTVLPRGQVAVSVPEKQTILILGTAGKLTIIRNLNVGRQSFGITYHQDLLYVVCRQPNSLLVLGMQGNVQKDIPLQTAQDQTFSKPLYIAVCKDRQNLYISDWRSHFEASLTVQVT